MNRRLEACLSLERLRAMGGCQVWSACSSSILIMRGGAAPPKRWPLSPTQSTACGLQMKFDTWALSLMRLCCRVPHKVRCSPGLAQYCPGPG